MNRYLKMHKQISSGFSYRGGGLLFFLIFAIALNLIAGSDGWLRIEPVRSDSAWFFMGGKSLMNGLTPYIDFADSKGPLVWLIYGLGYLISPQNFYGVFILEVIFYWLTFYVLFLSANLILKNVNVAIVASICMAFLFFYPELHNQIRVEDFCHIFNAITLYVLIRIIFLNDYKNWMAFVLGICVGALLMIKFSYALTVMIPIFVLFLFLNKKDSVLRCSFLCFFILGFIVIDLPIVIYLEVVGALGAFFKEYFFNTGLTIINLKEDAEFSHELWHAWPINILLLFRKTNFFGEYMRIILTGIILSLILFKSSRWMLFSLFFWYVGSIVLFSYNLSERYFLMLGIFAFGGIVWLARFVSEFKREDAIIAGACVLGIMAMLTTFYPYSEFSNPSRDIKALAEKEKIKMIIRKKERLGSQKPTIVYYNTWDKGEHIGTNAVAGVKYWAFQGGMTEQMAQEHENDIFKNKPDFVIINKKDKKLSYMLQEFGYKPCLEYNPWAMEENLDEWTYILYENS